MEQHLKQFRLLMPGEFQVHGVAMHAASSSTTGMPSEWTFKG
jgi:hypothetical protein